MTHIAFVIDPLESLNVKKDTTLAMIWAAQRRGWDVSISSPVDLTWRTGEMSLTAAILSLKCAPDAMANAAKPVFDVAPARSMSAQELDVIMMRKDPPFDMDYVNATYMLEQFEQAGVLVVNRPQSLRDCNEKYFTTVFPELLPPQIITSNPQTLLEFHAEFEDVVFKPLDGMGGKGIFRVTQNDPNAHVIVESLTNYGNTAIVGQRYLPDIKNGDKRILLIDGEPIPYALARIPKEGESRGNLAAGGTGIAQPLTPRDLEIAATVGPELRRRGLWFTGIDVIGDCLTEVNVTCPTCIRELDKACDLDIAMDLMNCIATKLT